MSAPFAIKRHNDAENLEALGKKVPGMHGHSMDEVPSGLSTQAHLPSKDKLSAHAKENAKGSNPGLEFKANQSGAGLSVGARDKDIDESDK